MRRLEIGQPLLIAMLKNAFAENALLLRLKRVVSLHSARAVKSRCTGRWV